MRRFARPLVLLSVVAVMAFGFASAACSAAKGAWKGIQEDLPATTGDVNTLRADHDKALAQVRKDFTDADGKIREDLVAQADAAQAAFKKAVAEGKTTAEALVIAAETNRTKATDDAKAATKDADDKGAKALAGAEEAKRLAREAQDRGEKRGGFIGLVRSIFGAESMSGLLDLFLTLATTGTGAGVAVNILRNRSRRKALATKADAPKPPTS